GREKGGMPTEEPFDRERLVVMTGDIQHHLDDPFDVAVRRFEGPDIDAQTAGDRGADLREVELLPFDLAALEDLGSEGLEDSFLPKVESEGLHVAHEPALFVSNGSQRGSQFFRVPMKLRPFRQLVDIHSTQVLRRL